MSGPMFKGGQGRSAEDVQADGNAILGIIFACLAGIGLWYVILRPFF